MKGSLTIGPREDHLFIKPGLHSHNAARQVDEQPSVYRVWRLATAVLFLLGLCGITYYAYTLSDQYVYQAYENWAFDQKIAGRHVTFGDYVRERTPFRFLTGGRTSTAKLAQDIDLALPLNSRPAQGAVLGRVQIPRLNLSAMVREGVDKETLSRAVGHLPYTALPGQTGNFAIAAHRDTLFRALKDIQKGDEIVFQSPTGIYSYEVVSTKIVKPSDLSVIQPEGDNKLLTMITCYPFYYVGSAPKRFIVRARLVEGITQSQYMESPPEAAAPNAQPKGDPAAASRKPRATRSGHASKAWNTPRARRKKPRLWRRLLHPKQG
jgi:sortase A